MATLNEACERFVAWLEHQTTVAGRGDGSTDSEHAPKGKYWLGRLVSEAQVRNSAARSGDRGERLEPCAVGLRLRPAGPGPWRFQVEVSLVAWLQGQDRRWRASEQVRETVSVHLDGTDGTATFGAPQLEAALASATGTLGLGAEVRCETAAHVAGGREVSIILVNTSPEESKDFADTRLYQCGIEVTGLPSQPFLLESLPDSFRYDRRVAAYGINCGVVETELGTFATEDVIGVSRQRPQFWGGASEPPDFGFAGLAADPLGPARGLEAALRQWGRVAWDPHELARRAAGEGWQPEMLEEARAAAEDFQGELDRIARGVELLGSDRRLQRAFRAMNRAMSISAAGRYASWRPFQFGFLLANLNCIVNPEEEADVVDIVWFATGGGKTETYLGLLITAAIHDRLRGKTHGITAWSRFPLRMLSLQQLQRFADALAAAETVRREERIGGDPFSLGFLVGKSSTPNSISPEPDPEGQWDVEDPTMPGRARTLERCPFCRQPSIQMGFNRQRWTLEHRCTNDACPWPEDALPFYVVDEEIYRFLPTILVGTLDKAASISMQAAMRGLVGAPLGLCSKDGHGFTYSKRQKRPQGCLVPGCKHGLSPLPMAPDLFAPSFRLQDELHLLKDSLGAVDAHYESLYDGLQQELSGRRAKILASSATLSGYERQSEVLYQRRARVFPQQGPSVGQGFWTRESDQMMRRFVAVAPKGVTIEFTVDRLLTVLQNAVRRLASEPEVVCREANVDIEHAPQLLSLYGTNVVYGNTLRDLDAVIRSTETQVQVSGQLNVDGLTGRTDFEQIRAITTRLENPEADFQDRLHVISASSMMSHGVDIDRLNVMVILGIPLTTAEFIQATSRVGRKYPGLVFVIHKIGRERDAGIFRSFPKFVEQGDRFVEPIPITRHSRRVLERTAAGLEMARVNIIHEPKSRGSLAMLTAFRSFLRSSPLELRGEAEVLLRWLGMDTENDLNLQTDLRDWFERFGRNVASPLPEMRRVQDASPTGPPMLSLRDVEETVPIYLNNHAR